MLKVGKILQLSHLVGHKMRTCKRIHKPFCLLLLQHIYSFLCSPASSFPRHTCTGNRSRITAVQNHVQESPPFAFPYQRPGTGGEGYTESVTACARKMAVGIKLYCWLILVHLFYNNKNKSISHKLRLHVCSIRNHQTPPLDPPFHWMLLALLAASFINNRSFSIL